MKTSKFTLLALILVVGVLSSCKKKKEEIQTPPSNVKSFTFSTTAAAWTLDNNKAYNAILTVEEIDADILSSGVVNVFLGDGTGSTWTAMPVTLQNIQSSYSISMHTAKITMSADDNISFTNPGVQQFRVIVIKGSARTANPTIDWNNYEQIKSTFHLAD
jgi:hypothetical protein